MYVDIQIRTGTNTAVKMLSKSTVEILFPVQNGNELFVSFICVKLSHCQQK